MYFRLSLEPEYNPCAGNDVMTGPGEEFASILTPKFFRYYEAGMVGRVIRVLQTKCFRRATFFVDLTSMLVTQL